MALATLADYKRVMADRPKKFSAAQVGYVDKAQSPERECRLCIHFYRGLQRNTCEITVGKDTESRNVPESASCDYWTVGDGTFPYLKARASEVGRRKRLAFEPTY